MNVIEEKRQSERKIEANKRRNAEWKRARAEIEAQRIAHRLRQRNFMKKAEQRRQEVLKNICNLNSVDLKLKILAHVPIFDIFDLLLHTENKEVKTVIKLYIREITKKGMPDSTICPTSRRMNAFSSKTLSFRIFIVLVFMFNI